MAERFLYLPSIAFCLIIAWLLIHKLYPLLSRRGYKALPYTRGLLLLVLLLFSLKTITRNPVWKDDYTLYTHDVATSENSAKGNNIAGQWYAWAANQPENAGQKEYYFDLALKHLRKAVAIHPTYQDALFHLGNVYYDYTRNLDSTLNCYYQLLRLDPDEDNVFRNLDLIVKQAGDPGKQEAIWKKVLSLSPDRYEPNFYLAGLYASRDLALAVKYMEAASKARPEDVTALKFLGAACLNSRQYNKSVTYYTKVIGLSPSDSEAIKNREIAGAFIR